MKWCRETPEAKYSLANPIYDKELDVLVYPTMEDGHYVLNPKTGDLIERWKPSKGKWEETMAAVALSKAGWIVSDLKGNVTNPQGFERFRCQTE